MKMKLSRGAKWTIILVGLCILCFIVVPLIVSPTTADPHAGHNHAEGDTHTQQAGHNHADDAHNKAAKDSYEVKQLENGSYTYRVVSRSGHSYVGAGPYATNPTVTAISNDVVKVSGMEHKDNNLSGWAAYYNVVGEGTSSRQFNCVLASTNNKVAYLDAQNGVFYVVTCNPFNEPEATYTALDGLAISETGSPKITYKVMENVLQVSYTAGKTKQVVNINL